MGRLYSFVHQVSYYETDMFGKLSIPMIFNLIVESSTKQALELNIDSEKTHKEGFGWILLHEELNINKKPKEGDFIKIITNVSEINSRFSKRDYEILDENNNILAYSTIFYAMVNINKRILTKIPEFMLEAYGGELTKKINKLKKPIIIGDDIINNKKEYTVGYSDIDSNRHVNNSKYIALMIDTLDSNYLDEYRIKYINIKYEQELLIDDKIKLEYSIKENKTLHRIIKNNNIVAESEIIWELKKEK